METHTQKKGTYIDTLRVVWMPLEKATTHAHKHGSQLIQNTPLHIYMEACQSLVLPRAPWDRSPGRLRKSFNMARALEFIYKRFTNIDIGEKRQQKLFPSMATSFCVCSLTRLPTVRVDALFKVVLLVILVSLRPGMLGLFESCFWCPLLCLFALLISVLANFYVCVRPWFWAVPLTWKPDLDHWSSASKYVS